MPQVKPDVRERLAKENNPKEVGDLCYIATISSLFVAWINEPRWTTIHNLYKKHVLNSNKLHNPYRDFSQDDWRTANELAWFEFYRRVGARYEDEKARENGDVFKDLPFAVEVKKRVRTILGEVKD